MSEHMRQVRAKRRWYGIELTLIASVPQADGGTREVHAQDATHARAGRRLLRDDPAMLDHLRGVDGIEVHTVDAGSTRRRER
jgi:hypothetical protein